MMDFDKEDKEHLRPGVSVWREGVYPANGIIIRVRWRDEEIDCLFYGRDDYEEVGVLHFSAIEWTDKFGGSWMAYK